MSADAYKVPDAGQTGDHPMAVGLQRGSPARWRCHAITGDQVISKNLDRYLTLPRLKRAGHNLPKNWTFTKT